MHTVDIQHKTPKIPKRTEDIVEDKNLNFGAEKTQNLQNLFGENRFATNDEVGVTLSNGEAWSGGLRPVIEG